MSQTHGFYLIGSGKCTDMQKMGNVKENEQAKRKIIAALLRLMENQPVSQIRITELIAEAGVARATYYRNFSSLESVIKEYLSILHADTIAGGVRSNQFSLDAASLKAQIASTASYLQSQRKELLCLYNNGFGTMLQEIINQYTEILLGDMPANSPDRYKIYFIAGALYDVLIAWLNSGTKESASEIAGICAEYLTAKKPLIS